MTNSHSCYAKNKTLSDPRTDEILALQGVSWFKRKIISIGTITLYIKHYKDDANVEHIDIDQTITGGIPGTTEKRTLTWTERENEDHLFGAVKGKSRRVKANELDIPFLKEGWTADTFEHGLVQSYVESDTPKSGTVWIANQVSLGCNLTLTLIKSGVDLGYGGHRWREKIRSSCQVYWS